ncbi:SPW repeat protein [Alicyclobacillus fastidiosus]|uniref:SPW repeat protein n=1 Tax=Alicyclobacillus fastidiosus TaxID=392011 RepID=A0ABY6ZFM9_9BACL|nr:SPW repeat protein [Alicyclobacillus fastidiosus]WAH41715.1 SPW repeat protein [Alicyclobacillus fastidiosus]GMA63396.1 hypothetical protein GCM10025859_38360 [Alicyclobacillus fastidiosus]
MWQLWLTGLIGIWVLISPWVYRFSSNTGALWNSIIFGAVTIILAIWALVAYKSKQ